jgi:aminoglycoside phosphotransferase (APT) family kinase protein
VASVPLFLRRRPPPEALRWVERSVGRGAHITSIRRLRGGTSAAVHLVHLRDRRGEAVAVVLRRFVRLDYFEREPDLAEREARILAALAATDLAAPQLVAVDPRGDECDVAAVLMTRLRGRLELAPADAADYVRQLAEPLPKIHALGVVVGMPSFYPYYLGAGVPRQQPAWCRDASLWRQTMALLQQPWPEAAPTLIHRDYHPGNILWQRGRLTGITDWVNASNGPVGADVAHMRSNLVDLFGLEVADAFRDAYEATSGASQHPFWDLQSAVDRDKVDTGQWHDAGRSDLTDALMARRREEYLRSLMRALC